MKELSIEEKAKRYDEAIEQLRTMMPNWENLSYYGKTFLQDLVYIIPELKESEDDRIKREIIDYLSTVDDKELIPYESWIAWLEKQGENEDKDIETKLSHAHFEGEIEGRDKVLSNPEKYGLQKIADKVEPKFKVGDIVKRKDNPHLTYILKRFTDDGDYEFHAIGKDGNEGCTCFSVVKYQDEWELVEQNHAEKFESKFKIEKDKWYVCIKDLLDNYANKAFHEGDTYLSTQDGSLIPSNSNVPFKVVCPDTYFRDWTLQDAKDGDVLELDCGIGIFKDKCIDGYNIHCYCYYSNEGVLEINKNSLYDTYQSQPATKEQRDTLERAITNAGYEWDAEKKELKNITQNPVSEMKTPEESLGVDSDTYNKIVDECIYGEQNPTWSEDDDVNLIRAQAFIRNTSLKDVDEIKESVLTWITSLKVRVQPKQEWSKDDRKIIIELIGIFESAIDGGYVDIPYRLIKDYIRVLKSCLPQTTWKPSEEQMDNK